MDNLKLKKNIDLGLRATAEWQGNYCIIEILIDGSPLRRDKYTVDYNPIWTDREVLMYDAKRFMRKSLSIYVDNLFVVPEQQELVTGWRDVESS